MSKDYSCKYCDKPYKSRSGAYKHERTCHKKPGPVADVNPVVDPDVDADAEPDEVLRFDLSRSKLVDDPKPVERSIEIVINAPSEYRDKIIVKFNYIN
jgi:hypothetical protein